MSPEFEHLENLPSLATGRKGNNAILGTDKAQVPVRGIAWMDVRGRSPSRTKRRGEFAGDMSGLAHPGRQYVARRVSKSAHGLLELRRDTDCRNGRSLRGKNF